MPATYMFDAAGARLYACMRTVDDLGVTAGERAIWRLHAPALAEAIGPRATFVDTLCGNGEVASLVAPRLRGPLEIVLADRVPGAAARAATTVRAGAPATPLLALDTTDPWAVRPPRGVERTVVHLGAGLAAEITPPELVVRLARLRVTSGHGGGVLVGVPLRGTSRAPESTFADRGGIAASFDLNLLARINRELKGGFQLAAWSHRAVWEENEGRVAMQLVSKRSQWACIGSEWFSFGSGEAITTMVSYRYTLESFAALTSSAGWRLERVFLDPERTYALVLLGR